MTRPSCTFCTFCSRRHTEPRRRLSRSCATGSSARRAQTCGHNIVLGGLLIAAPWTLLSSHRETSAVVRGYARDDQEVFGSHLSIWGQHGTPSGGLATGAETAGSTGSGTPNEERRLPALSRAWGRTAYSLPCLAHPSLALGSVSNAPLGSRLIRQAAQLLAKPTPVAKTQSSQVVRRSERCP
jgi:hypothetical protein